MLLVQVVPLDKDCGHVENQGDEYESNALGVAKKEARDVRFLDSSLARHHEQRGVPFEDHVDILWAKGDHCAIVEDDV